MKEQRNAPLLQRKLPTKTFHCFGENYHLDNAYRRDCFRKNISLSDDLKEAKRKVYERVDQVAKIEAEKNFLAKKVCTLLNENLKWQRGYSETHEDNCSITIKSDECVLPQIISKHVVKFKDIKEPQTKNQQLLPVSRASQINKKKVERLAFEYRTGTLKNAFEDTKIKVRS